MEMRLRCEVGFFRRDGLFSAEPCKKFLMKQLICKTVALAILLTGDFVPVAHGQIPNEVGVTLLQKVATNVDGTGIRVAQVEGGYDLGTNWEVNPTVVGRTTNSTFITYISAAGSTSNFPNSLSSESSHADTVGFWFYGVNSGIATNVAHVDNYEANYFVTTYVEVPSPPSVNAAVVNQSFSFGALTISQQQQIDSNYDNCAAINKTLFVSAVDNGGNVHAPGTSYNGIGVAGYSTTASSSIGPTIDNGRCKPDITAPDANAATSYTTPLVAGAAAALMQAALRGDGGGDTNSAFDMRTIKALLLNGAVKPLGWTNGNSTPLDARHGAGMLNVFNSYRQLAGGKNSFIASTTVSSGGAHPPNGAIGTVTVLNGWDFNTNTSVIHPTAQDAIKHYYFNVTNGTGRFVASATLVWNRQQNQSSINNLNLFLYNCANSNLVLCSTSLVDNVEHIYTNGLPAGRYDLQVWKAGGSGIVSASEAYALAWAFVPPPTVAISGGVNPALNWPVYPAGFLVEARTNLLTDAWSTNNLPASVLTGSTNILQLPLTNALQFFRLRSPNF
jgi:hypothetical protein